MNLRTFITALLLSGGVVLSGGEMTRRAEFRAALAKNPETAIAAGLKSPDSVIRNRAVFELYAQKKMAALPELVKLASESDPQVAGTIFACAVDMKEKNNSDELLKTLAEKSGLDEIKRKANRLTSFNFHRVTPRLKDNPTFDHDIATVKSIALPLEGWSFRVDPIGNAHKKGWFAPDFNDSKWRKLKIGAWESQGYPGYDGVAWYRIRFTMPEKIDSNAVELFFRAVDECAWVWLNGVYVGQHDIGPGGWNKPFWLDVTREIKWGGENVLVVRVEDSAAAGGIWKPVSVEVLK